MLGVLVTYCAIVNLIRKLELCPGQLNLKFIGLPLGTDSFYMICSGLIRIWLVGKLRSVPHNLPFRPKTFIIFGDAEGFRQMLKFNQSGTVVSSGQNFRSIILSDKLQCYDQIDIVAVK